MGLNARATLRYLVMTVSVESLPVGSSNIAENVELRLPGNDK